jgi:hypothetical protein
VFGLFIEILIGVVMSRMNDVRDDNKDNNNMERYEKIVRDARNDASGNSTQAKMCYGYILARAKLSRDDLTMELRQAARDYGTKEWWQLPHSYIDIRRLL